MRYLILDAQDGHVIDGAIGREQLDQRTWWRESGTYTIEVAE